MPPLDRSGVEAGEENFQHLTLPKTNVRLTSLFRKNSSDPRMYITALVDSTPLMALIDTGGTHTCLPSSAWDMLQDSGFIIRPINGLATVADGGNAEITGVVRLTFTLGKYSNWTGDVFLLKSLPFPLLIGMNTLEGLEAKLDFKNSTISVSTNKGNELIQVLYMNSQTNTSLISIQFNISPLKFEDGVKIYLGQESPDSNKDRNNNVVPYECEDPVFPSNFITTSLKEKVFNHPLVSPEQNLEFSDFLSKWMDKFSLSPGVTDVSECKIYVDRSVPPIKQRSLRMSLADQQLAEAEIQRLLELDIIEPSESEWCSPAFLVDKKDGSKRLVVNYKALNNVSQKNSAPLPRMDECLKILQKSNYVSTIDMQQGFYQVKMSEDSSHYTAFCVAPSHFYQFKRMPFGLCNSPAVFQTMIEKVLRPLLFKTCFVYVDDLLITSDSFDDHKKNLNEVFELLFKAGLAINWKKCSFLRAETEFLGFIVGSGKIQAAPSKLNAVKMFDQPKCVKDLRRFLGMVGWFRAFIPNLADKSACLNELLKTDEPFLWTDEREASFQELKSCLTNPPILAVPDPSIPYEIHTDASDRGLGAVLIQRKNNQPYVIAFASRSLSKHEKQYPITQKECLALIWAVEKWKHYIVGNGTTTCITDHSSLLWLANLKAPTNRLARWVCRLSEFDLKIIHKKGKFNFVPDCLSRSPPNIAATDVKLPDFNNITDRWYLELRQLIINKPNNFPAFEVQHPYILKYVKHPVTGQVEHRYIVPSDFRQKFINEYHSTLNGGHLGIAKTFHKLADRFYWPKMKDDIKTFVRACQICQQYKTSNLGPAGHMKIREPFLEPFSAVCADLIGPLPMTPERFRFALVIVDLATKFVIAKPIRTATAENIVKIFRENLVLVHGCPQMICTDNASQFSGRVFGDFCNSVNAKHHLIPIHFPSANPCERYIKSLKTMISTFAQNDHRRWAEHLSYMVFALNTSRNETTSFTPARLTFGRELRSPFELAAPLQKGTATPFDPLSYDGEIQGSLKRIFKSVRESASKAQEVQAKVYNTRRRGNVTYPVGSLVWRTNFVQSDAAARMTAKLCPKYIGPFKVSHIWSPTQVELSDLQGHAKGRWHISHLKPCIGINAQPDSG